MASNDNPQERPRACPFCGGTAELEQVRARLERAEAEIAKQMRRATDAEYMGRAYRNMLGPKGLEVAAMWDAKGIKRVHFDWEPSAAALSGEERASTIIAFENAPRTRVDNIDGGEPPPAAG